MLAEPSPTSRSGTPVAPRCARTNVSPHQSIRRADPIVPRRLRMAVPERMSSDGDVIVPLDLRATEAAGRFLVEQGVQAIAIAFVNAYANPAHEQAAARLLSGMFTDISISTSA